MKREERREGKAKIGMEREGKRREKKIKEEEVNTRKRIGEEEEKKGGDTLK